jgi:NADH-quinone oxidoreductase subunit E
MENVRVKEEFSLTVIDAITYKHNARNGAVISILQEVQDTYGCVSKAAIQRIAENTGVPASEIFGIVTFYAQFRLEHIGENVIKICHGTACHLNGAERVSDSICKCTGTKEGETSHDGKFTVESVACLGCCSLAPAIMVNGEVHARLTAEKINNLVEDLNEKTPAE